jgi:hypothetical protein
MRRNTTHSWRENMKTIDVEGIPEPLARTFALMIQAVREQLKTEPTHRPRVKLPVHEGTILRPITRRDLYADVG